MKRRLVAPALVSVIFFSFIGACNYPGVTPPTPFAIPTETPTAPAFVVTPNFGALPTATVPSPTAAQPTQTASPAPTHTSTSTEMIPTATTGVPTVAITPIPTRTPTATAAPTVSYAGPGVRSGARMSAQYLDERPTLDGVFDEWDLADNFARSVVMGAANWNGEADLSARVTWGWDEDNLYLAARVKDDRYVQNAGGENIFKGDSVEILIDVDVSDDYYLESLNEDDFQLGISPGSRTPGTDPEAYLWYPNAGAGARQRVKVGAMSTDDGYRIEAAIPWNTFGVSPRSGRHFGFAFSVSDNDRPGETIQQSMVSTAAGRSLTDPTTWGDLELSAAVPSARSNASVESVKVSSAPAIDGSLREWDSDSYPLSSVVYGSDRWEGALDLSGIMQTVWDDQNLYLGVEVTDNRYVQSTNGVNLFLGDSLEILFDADLQNDFYYGTLSADDYQLGISPGTGEPGNQEGAYLWYPSSKEGSRSQVVVAASAADTGYIVEAAIPWDVFGVSPRAGARFGFAFSVSDNDNRDRDIQQTMISNIPRRQLTDPTTWGGLHLVGP